LGTLKPFPYFCPDFFETFCSGIGEWSAPHVKWLDYDPIVAVVLMVGLAAVVSLALSI
jgi:hypothetical protein